MNYYGIVDYRPMQCTAIVVTGPYRTREAAQEAFASFKKKLNRFEQIEIHGKINGVVCLPHDEIIKIPSDSKGIRVSIRIDETKWAG